MKLYDNQSKKKRLMASITLVTLQSRCRSLIGTSNHWLALADFRTLAGAVTILVPQLHQVSFSSQCHNNPVFVPTHKSPDLLKDLHDG